MNKADYYTPAWHDLQDSVLAAAAGRCADCGWPARVAHHKSYAGGVVCDPRFLVALCHQCHDIRHGLGCRQREHYTDYMARNGWREVGATDRWTMREPGYYWQRTA